MHAKENTNNYLFVSLTNDLLFKETFGLPSNVRFLEYFLEVYFNYPRGCLKNKLNVSYESPLDKTRYFDRGFRNDLKVIINNEIICNIEMYSSFNKDSWRKSKSYIMRIYSTQLNVGDDISSIKKVTQINFVDNISAEIKVAIEEEVKKTFYLGPKNLSDDFNLDIVRLDLARDIDYNYDDRFMRLLKFISANSLEERESIAKGDEMLMEINNWVNNYMTEDEWWRTYNSDYWNKRIYHEDGRNEGIETSKNEIAKKMLAKGTPIEEISDITELSLEEVKALQNQD